MSASEWKRREFIQTLVATLAAGALDWSVLPVAHADAKGTNEFDAIILGSGLGGLSCAAAFARQGFKVLVWNSTTKQAATQPALSVRVDLSLRIAALHRCGRAQWD